MVLKTYNLLAIIRGTRVAVISREIKSAGAITRARKYSQLRANDGLHLQISILMSRMAWCMAIMAPSFFSIQLLVYPQLCQNSLELKKEI